MEGKVLLQTEVPGMVLFARGKVRDTWEIPRQYRTNGEELLLMVTTDRISAFDVIMARGVPELGKVRNQISLFWFHKLAHVSANHVVSSDQGYCAAHIPARYREPNDLMGRCVLIRRAEVIPVECVVRGYLSGLAWESYQREGTVCGVGLPPGLKESEELPQPIFTPATKARTGHDEPIDFDTMIALVSGEVAEELRSRSIQLYAEAGRWARSHGLIIADTKFEFGIYRGRIILVDELLTPDSSRFWDLATYQTGGPQPSFDKQPLRDWLKASGWNKEPPPPPLPDEVVEGIRTRYITAYERLTEKTWSSGF